VFSRASNSDGFAAIAEGSTTVDLSNLGLTYVPEQIALHTHVESVVLSSNHLSSLPLALMGLRSNLHALLYLLHLNSDALQT
jgi:hypothetical protein